MARPKQTSPANDNKRIVAMVTYAPDCIIDRRGRVYMCETGAAFSAYQPYKDAYGIDIWGDKILPFHCQVLGNEIDIKRVWGFEITAEENPVRFFFSNNFAYYGAAKNGFYSGSLAQLAAIGWDKVFFHVLGGHALTPPSVVTSKEQIGSLAKKGLFKRAARLIVKKPRGAAGKGDEMAASLEEAGKASVLDDCGASDPFVVQRAIDVKPVSIPDHGEFRSSFRVFVTFLLREDGSFEHEVHGIVRDIASEPITADSKAAWVSSMTTGTEKHPVEMQVAQEDEARLTRFIRKRFAPLVQRLMSAPFHQVVKDAESDALARNRPYEAEVARLLIQSEHAPPHLYMADAFAPMRDLKGRKNLPKDYYPNVPA
jgi:hypothetical protein